MVRFRRSRERNAARFWGSSYDKVSVHGKLHVTSYKREAVRVEIEKRLQGELTKNPNQAALESLAEGLFGVNPSLRLSWSLPLEPGKALTLEYEYTLYVSS